MSQPVPASPATPSHPVTRREVLGWCFYDVADSAYTTVIVTVLFSVYFGTVVVGDTGRADLLWGLASSISELVVALIAPVLGAMADFSGSRKKALAACATTVAVFTAALWFVQPGMVVLGLALYILANVGFAGGGVFIDSFLPGLSTTANAGRISGLKWAMGYAGGLLALTLCLPLASSIRANPSPEDLDRARLIPLVVAGWYALAVLPTFFFVRDRSTPQILPPGQRLVTVGFRRLGETFRQVRRYRELVKLLIAFLIYNDGIVTVIAFSARYAKETIGFETGDIVKLFIVMNVIALLGALSFGWLADRIGQKRTILISLGLWLASTSLAYVVETKQGFFVVATLAGLGMGSCQSVTRSLVALFTPKDRAAEFFGFLGIAGRALAFLGPLLFGFLSHTTGSQRPAILAIGAFFLVGALVLLTVDEAKGKAAARGEDPSPVPAA